MNVFLNIAAWACLIAVGIVIGLAFRKEGGLRAAVAEFKSWFKEDR